VLGPKTIEQFSLYRQTFLIQEYVRKLDTNAVQFITREDTLYPKHLLTIQKAPYVLYVKGNPHVLSEEQTIAIVGTRKVTNYGRQVTEMLTQELVQSGFTIVSGLALGVDAIAHQMTVQNHGKTIAVLGCGVDCCYPSSNQKIYDEIIESGGCIISELPLSHQPTVGSFPARNRIIAGLSLAVLVTEGAADSGSLITADEALKNNRRVFAVPGPITSSLSVGPYRLLKDGAVLVSSVEEIFSELGINNPEVRNKEKVKGDTKEEQEILDLLQNEQLHFDEIVRFLAIDSSEVSSILTIMELKGMIKSLDGGNFSLSS
jgi:DNA processing protein